MLRRAALDSQYKACLQYGRGLVTMHDVLGGLLQRLEVRGACFCCIFSCCS
jgi:hypothetical protein